MPVIEILGTADRPPVRTEATGPLVDACDEACSPVEFSCRTANCGTCRVLVLAGGDLLEPARSDEVEVLALHGSDARQRLACQVIVCAGPGIVRLRWIGRSESATSPRG